LVSAVADPGVQLCTSAEALQELLHAYIPVGRIETSDAALLLAQSVVPEIWPLEPKDVAAARDLTDRRAGLGACDLLHLACCRQRGVTELKSYDRASALPLESD
jgi:predicted nucleic acid-binding protein